MHWITPDTYPVNLFDSRGEFVAVLLLGDTMRIHRIDGTLLAEIDDGATFNTSGEHIGWMIRNQLHDRDGMLVLASRRMNGTQPSAAEPASGTRARNSPRSERQTIPMQRPVRADTWAPVSGLAFFGIEESAAETA